MSQTGRAEAAAAVWSWRESASAPEAQRARAGELRRRGLVRVLVAGVVGGAVALFWSPLVGRIALSIAAVLALAALLSPLGIYALIERALGALVRVTGSVLTRVLMALVFFCFFTPFGLLLRRGRRDPLRRFRDPAQLTYWETAEPGRSASASRGQTW